MVWNRRLGTTILPAVAFLADTAVGILYIFDSRKRNILDQIDITNDTKHTLNTSSRQYLSSIAILEKTYDISRIGLFSVTLSLNICCTFLIAFQIWRTQRRVFKHSPQVGYLKYTLVTIIESGVVYSTWIAILLATYSASGRWQMLEYNISTYAAYLFFQDTTVQIIAITFSTIIFRIGRGVSMGDGESQNRNSGRSHANFRSGVYSSSPATIRANGREVQIQVSFDRRIWHDDSIKLEGPIHPNQPTSAISVQDLEDSNGVNLSLEESA